MGSSEYYLRASVSPRKRQLQVTLLLNAPNGYEYFRLLQARQKQIEAGLGSELNWKPPVSGRTQVISCNKTSWNPLDDETWDAQTDWIANMLRQFYDGFGERLRELDPADWQPNAEDEAG